MIIAAVLSIVISLMEFNNGLKPFVVEKVEAVVEAVGQDINYAIEVGVPFDQIRGLDDYISNLISDHPEIVQKAEKLINESHQPLPDYSLFNMNISHQMQVITLKREGILFL